MTRCAHFTAWTLIGIRIHGRSRGIRHVHEWPRVVEPGWWVQSRYELHGAAVKNADATSLYLDRGWETSGPRFIIPNLDYSLYRLILIPIMGIRLNSWIVSIYARIVSSLRLIFSKKRKIVEEKSWKNFFPLSSGFFFSSFSLSKR